MGYLVLRERPPQFQALTSLLPAEFDELLTDFAPAWERYHRWHTLDGAKRRLPAHQERANATPAGSDVKLLFSQKLYNQLLSPLRVVIEHAHSGIKRLRMVGGTLRLRGEAVRDLVMVVACGLHNLRVRSPHRAYLVPAPAKFPNYPA